VISFASFEGDGFMPSALRIIAVEYLQNLPILVGLMLALKTPNWALSLVFVALGAFGTALTIHLTERIKLRDQASDHPTPLLVNSITFLIGSGIYLVYFRLVRSAVPYPVLADVILGGGLGLLMGAAQGYGRGVGRLDRDDWMHMIGLLLAGAALCNIIGFVADSWPPLVAALILCVVMTLIIARLDYWELITGRASGS
jgi:hypothetical protein